MKTLLYLSTLLWSAATPLASAGSATWSINPSNGDWNTATNWMPNSIPNSPSDVATFGFSNTLKVGLSASPTEVAEIDFSAGASAFDVTTASGVSLTISGAGVINNSGVTQKFFIGAVHGSAGSLFFLNNTTAGANVIYTAYGAGSGGSSGRAVFSQNSTAGSATFIAQGATRGLDVEGGGFEFKDHSTAGTANFTVKGAQNLTGFNGGVGFEDFSSADHAVFVINAGNHLDFDGGVVGFSGNATAANGVFTLNGANAKFTRSQVLFGDAATAGNGYFTVNGGQKSDTLGGEVYFSGYTFTGLITTAGNATFVNNGGTGAGSIGGITEFGTSTTGGEAHIVANGGVDGGGPGTIYFFEDGDGGQAQIELNGDGALDVSYRFTPGLTIGSLAGDGMVYLGPHLLAIGSNNLSTTFSGVLQENGGIDDDSPGSVTKIGTGSLILTGASTYGGGTTVSGGVLRVANTTGSGTGKGAISVTAGTLGGKGIIAGAVTVGTGSGAGAILQSSIGVSQTVKLTIQGALTFKSDGTYVYKLSTQKANADQVVAKGVTINNGAQFKFTVLSTKRLATGTVFTAISNTSATPISGTFANLADNSTLTAGPNSLKVSYTGGDGNDLTLTVVP